MLIGILGGTFDPIHDGHLHVATHLLKHCCLDEVRLLPCYSPVHRDQPAASALDRVAMIKLNLNQQPHLNIDTREIDRGGPSYMIDTLQSLRKDFPNDTLCLILGDDAFAKFDQWKNWQNIMDYCHLIIVHRPNTTTEYSTELKKFIDQHQINEQAALHEHMNGSIYFHALPPSSVSATEIRAQLARHEKNIIGLSPEVAEYISQQGLYN